MASRITPAGRTYRQNSRKCVRAKKSVFWAKCGVFPKFCRPQLYPIRLIFEYIMSNYCQGYQTPKFHVRTFFTSPRYRPKGGRFFVFLLKSGRKFGPKYPGVGTGFYQIPSEKRRFSYIPTFRHFVRLSMFCYRNSNAIIIIACGHEKIIYSK